jgi:hypothetical protein
MSPKSKFLWSLLVSVAVGFGIIDAWSISGRDWVGYLIFGWLLIATWIMYHITCPRCGAGGLQRPRWQGPDSECHPTTHMRAMWFRFDWRYETLNRDNTAA